MRADGESVTFDAPCLLLVPAGIIHGFSWHRDSRGWVITIADSYLHHLLEHDADFPPLFRAPRVVALPDVAEVEARIGTLARELAWSGPGQRAAVDALLLWLMVQALRHAALSGSGASSRSRQAQLVARLRERIEQRFRHREPVADHARALGVSETALRCACAHAARLSPAAMLDERALLEARRLLLYSTLSVAEVGYAIGFEDPAYFSRFFARHTGRSPRDWRAARGQAISPS